MIGDHARFIELFKKITDQPTVRSLDFGGAAYKHEWIKGCHVWIDNSRGVKGFAADTYVEYLEQIATHLENES